MVQEFIARDTKQPLIVFGAYRIDSRGGIIRQTVSGPISKPMATESDVALLQTIGRNEIEAKQLFGVLDRLKNSELI